MTRSEQKEKLLAFVGKWFDSLPAKTSFFGEYQDVSTLEVTAIQSDMYVDDEDDDYAVELTVKVTDVANLDAEHE